MIDLISCFSDSKSDWKSDSDSNLDYESGLMHEASLFFVDSGKQGRIQEIIRSLLVTDHTLRLLQILYKGLCLSIRPSVHPSVGPSIRLSVRPSVGPSVGPSVTLLSFSHF